jgi:hypothetical protein
MAHTLTDIEIADRLAELQLSFPVVAPRLLMNLELDRDSYFGFDSPVLRVLAKHQVPILIDSYLRLGAFARDLQSNCGYRAKIKHRVTDGKNKTKEEKAEYFRGFANLIAERIAEGHPNKMHASTFVMTEQQYEELIQKIMPTLRDLRSISPSSDARGVRVVFCGLMETSL